MKRVRELFRKFQSMDGKIKIGTLSGVTAVAAAIALFVGVLPAMAVPGAQLDADVPPAQVNYGGGDGGCAFVDSAASNELHINNPMDGSYTDGTVTITIDVYEADTLFSFSVDTPGYAVYDVTVNGGAKSNHYDYDDVGSGPVGTDDDLHAPAKGNGDLFNLSHINFCYDVQLFFCDGRVTNATRLNDGIFTQASAQLLRNSVIDTCQLKDGVFVIDNTDTEDQDPNVQLDFGTGGGTVAGRLDITKDFGSPDFTDLLYGEINDINFADIVDDCVIDTKDVAGGDGDEFNDVLENDEYPRLPAGETACKVYEGENAAGVQYNVIYFEFEDPHFF